MMMTMPRTLGPHGLRRPPLSLRTHTKHIIYRNHNSNSALLSRHLRRAPIPPPPLVLSISFPAPRSLILIPTTHRRRHTLQTPSPSSSTSSPPTPQPPSPSPPPYTPPTHGILSHLPRSIIPYAELLRIDKPTGTYYLFFPCLFSTLLAAPLTLTPTPPLTVLSTTILFLSGAFIMRGAGCAINDLWDRKLDPRVTRTRHRPVARGAVTPLRGVAFVGANLLFGLAILLQFPATCLLYGVPSLLLVALYPLAKRVTYYPQFVLGLTFSWGALMGFPALGIDYLGAAPVAQSVLGVDVASFLGFGVDATTTAANNAANPLLAASLLYLSNVSWTVLYDMIYAHMDIRDDARAGIKSIALAHAASTKPVLSLLASVQIGLLAGAGWAAGAGPAFFVGSCGGAALTLGWMIRRVRLESVRDCWWWFVNGCWITGGTIAAGLGVDYVVRYLEVTRKGDDDADDDDDSVNGDGGEGRKRVE